MKREETEPRAPWLERAIDAIEKGSVLAIDGSFEHIRSARRFVESLEYDGYHGPQVAHRTGIVQLWWTGNHQEVMVSFGGDALRFKATTRRPGEKDKVRRLNLARHHIATAREIIYAIVGEPQTVETEMLKIATHVGAR